MRVYALADPHLAIATPDKEMTIFGEQWRDHTRRLENAWRAVVLEEDLVLVPGDISWAMRLAGARADLEFLAGLPGRKVLCRGNHDYWWSSLSKVRAALPPRVFALGGDALVIDNVALAATRLWDVPGLDFTSVIDWQKDHPRLTAGASLDDEAKAGLIYLREFLRLRRALDHLAELRQQAGAHSVRLNIAMCHYPPVSAELAENDLTQLFEQYAIQHVVFGHLHAVKPGPIFGQLRSVTYHLCSADYLEFCPRLIAED